MIKFLYSFFLPPAVFFGPLIWLIIRLARRHERTGAAVLGITTLLMYLVSMPLGARVLLQSLENRYSLPANPAGDVIIMMGGGAIGDRRDVGGIGILNANAANRLLSAVRLQRATGLPIILSGGKVYAYEPNESRIAYRQLLQLGVPAGKILLEDQSRNTTESAQFIRSIMKRHHWKTAILVTSAFHMERSVRNFRAVQIDVVPYPVDYMTGRTQPVTPMDFVPGGFGMASIAVKEYLGIAAAGLGIW
ncbi:MAG: YdcF family protein [Solirubrobacterales bacterium]